MSNLCRSCEAISVEGHLCDPCRDEIEQEIAELKKQDRLLTQGKICETCGGDLLPSELVLCEMCL